MGRFRLAKNKRSQLGLRLGILLVGSLALVSYTYLTGQWPNGSDEDGMLVTEWDNPNAYNNYHRGLSTDDPSNSAGENYNKCRDPELDDQGNFCVGYGSDACKKLAPSSAWLLIFVILALLYLFVGIAIVCDELFVPALEIVAEDFELSNDVAGATLMAAGGSAPELATSFVGTFKRSDVGFGTIVGSAVFNVLFVIGMCVIFTPAKYAPLELTWWPLFRDCSYYVITLAFLAVFMYDGKIELWESIIQFLLYFGYVYMMAYSSQLEAWLISKLNNGQVTPVKAEALDDIGSKELDAPVVSGGAEEPSKGNASFLKPSTFRVGILQLLTSKTSLTETAGIAFVAKIKGDVNVVFDRIDTNKNGQIDKNELKNCLQELGTPDEELTDEMIDKVMNDIDKNSNGYATKSDFTVWYLGNETRLKNKTREIFDKYDSDGKGTIPRRAVHDFMVELGHNSKDIMDAIDESVSKIESSAADPDYLTYVNFTTWYENSLFWENEKNNAEAAVESQESMWDGVVSGWSDLFDNECPWRAKLSYVICLPLSLLFCLIPDCRSPGKEGYAFGTLFGSIIMIALFAIVMVELAEIFGATVGIPTVVMGLTLLAAGTSVPDLLSSVIVAQQGQGDMAVSSSIGSNIFDVAFGLPLPWLCFNIAAIVKNCECGVEVAGSPSSLVQSLLILLAMVAAIVMVIHYSSWKMTHQLGLAMFGMYFLYLIVALSPLTTDPKEYVVDNCAPFNLNGR